MANDPEFPLPIQTGSIWCWEPLKPELKCQVKVRATHWDQEWYIEIEALEDAGHMWLGMRTWYHLGQFVDAAVLMDPSAP